MEHIHGWPMAGRTVLVTGATSGIGRATALGLATMGAHLAITGRDRGRTENAALEISAVGGRNVEMLVADLSYSGGRANGQSKLANVLFTYQLARRMRESAVTANALHPGVVRTSFGAEDPARIERLLAPLRRTTRSSTRSYDRAVAARLGEASADLVGLTAAPRV